ncbi:hypothetical protein QCA50_001958 [Cerrena zonata]|uniref:Uncharacterized protein n=1 Tax=Cerrena zonata TaxID=2478898 RepID=A0AAW0GNL5_9APHY
MELASFESFRRESAREILDVVFRLFIERLIPTSHPIEKIVALFGIYTFYFSQPSTSGPSLYSLKHIPIPIDIYRSLLDLHNELTDEALQPLQPYATRLLTTLLDAQVFHILPEASLLAQNPSVLPREIFVPDGVDPSTILGTASGEASTSGTQKQPKKKGRPSKRDKAKRAKDAVLSLDKWLEKNSFTYPTFATDSGSGLSLAEDATKTTHALIAHRPITQQQHYSAQKNQLLALLDSGVQDDVGVGSSSRGSISDQHQHPGKAALSRANEAILARLRKIDEMAAEQGLEVGGEGGEMTGLSRVEKAVADYREGKSRGGILELVEGGRYRVWPAGSGCCYAGTRYIYGSHVDNFWQAFRMCVHVEGTWCSKSAGSVCWPSVYFYNSYRLEHRRAA